MRALLHWLFTLFLSPGGLLVLAALDSLAIFYVPFDVVLIILAARNPPRLWLYPIMATLGSLVGAAITYRMGKKLRETGLEHLISRRRFKKLKQKMSAKGPLALALPALIPPPFPFTGVLLTYGAMKINERKLLAALGLMRLVRFSVESLLALRYGPRMIGWMKSDSVEAVVWALTTLAIAGSFFSAYRFIKKTRN
jgi:membrane protein YqaA with SNARE-associated domain